MRYTLLQLTQRILESMGSDEVNTIGDTTESLAVANIIKECFFELMSESLPKELDQLFHLEASTDAAQPVFMHVPTNVLKIDKIRYNVEDENDINLRDLVYVSVEDLMRFSNGLESSADWVAQMVVNYDADQFLIKYRNDKSPHYWTSIDDRTVLFDSYDKSMESTLTSMRTYCYGTMAPKFELQDNFIPDLDPRNFQLLLQEAKAQAFLELKQTENRLALIKGRRQRILLHKTKDRTDPRREIRKHRGYGR